jgi:2-phospho-L-lactate guanylyltransferase
MAASRIWAVVPVKQFPAAKIRLAPVLNLDERTKLARVMFEDVLDVLVECEDILADALVVTSDPEAVALARHRGASLVLDKADRGINAAISHAVRRIDAPLDGLMVVPTDIPHVTRRAFADAAKMIEIAPSLAIAAAADDGGTNLFACRPMGAIAPQFGPLSFDRHHRAALQANVAVEILSLPELSLDLDRPENLRTFLTLGSSTRAHEFLSSIRVLERIKQDDGMARRALDHAVARA